MGIYALLSNDKVLETGINGLVSILAFLILFFGYPQENAVDMEIPFETQIPANVSFCLGDTSDKSKTTRGVISTTSVYASVNFTNKLAYPAVWEEMTDNTTRCLELYPTMLGRGDLVAGGWGPDADDEAARVDYLTLFSEAQINLVKAMSNKKVKGVGTEVWTVEKFAPEQEYQEQFDVCLTAKTTIGGSEYEWFYYTGDCTAALYIIGKNSVISQESVNVNCQNPNIAKDGGEFKGDLGGVLDPLASLDKLFKQTTITCTVIENADANKVFGIALGYGALVAGAAMAAKSAMMKARENIQKLRKGGIKEVGSMVAKADIGGGE